MITIRRADDRGQGEYGWLQARYSFAFANYHDKKHMGFQSLRVMNEDRINGGGGFPTHSHRDMEILTYVISGGLEHRDSMGNGSLISAGDFQLMSAGTGVHHSEINTSSTHGVHLMQIWILPDSEGLKPSYQQKSFVDRENSLRLVMARDGREGALKIHQDLDLFSGLLSAGQEHRHELAPDRHAWIQVVRGSLRVNDELLSAGDGASISAESALDFQCERDTDLLLFDMA